MDIKPATQDDLASICELADQVNATHHYELPHIFTHPEDSKGSMEFWSNQLKADNSTFLVAKNNDSVVGFITANLTENVENPFLTSTKVCRVSTVIVSECLQKQGIGSKLMGAVENWAREFGAKDISLTVMEFNKNAHSFYINNGYVITSRTMLKPII